MNKPIILLCGNEVGEVAICQNRFVGSQVAD
jgi:hypothetical protein